MRSEIQDEMMIRASSQLLVEYLSFRKIIPHQTEIMVC
jgi:hypothetical protein